ncbi:hypothetical protein AKJ51_01540 [candidate division MSBL1 archaeon SCGC-AAA382A20]|uniref:TFIIB-type domain-containing protein n=1 Tax=candidate division MSBL1 archaeon SCGC-AAA382A20 TaxID=1698280 RepID=A0A133VLL5_9EURY|nr:hypothetical protein AKJ51_01540 [candidate division MSBL1 archaeon SCGC-AAA382A20]
MKCPECKGKVVMDYERSEKVCQECGLVVRNVRFRSNGSDEELNENSENYRHRKNISHRTYDGGLSTVMSKRVNGNVDGKTAGHYRRMSKMDRRMKLQEYRNRLMKDAIIEIENQCSKLNVPTSSTEDAIDFFEKCYRRNLTQGRAEEVVYSSVIYMICRRDGIPITIDEMAEKYGLCSKQISRFYRTLKDRFEVEIPLQNISVYIEKYSSDLSVPNPMMIQSKKLVREVELKMSGKKPNGIAGSIIYYISEKNDFDLSVKEISDVCNVSWNTIYYGYKDIENVVE